MMRRYCGKRTGGAVAVCAGLLAVLFVCVHGGSAAPAVQEIPPCADHYIYLPSGARPGPTGTGGGSVSTARPPCGTATPAAPNSETPIPVDTVSATPTLADATSATPTPGDPVSATPTLADATSATPTPTDVPSATLTAVTTVSPTPTDLPTQVPSQTPAPTATPVPVPATGRIGVQLFESDYTAVRRGEINTAQASWVRTRALWKSIEPNRATPARYNWGMSDAMISVSALQQLRPIVAVYDWPAWATDLPGNCGPLNDAGSAAYPRFLKALVERYDGDGVGDAMDFTARPPVKHWEIGNEPDFAPSAAGGENDYGSCFGDDPGQYAELLRASYGAIKSADPQAHVLFGGVAFDRFIDGEGGNAGPFRRDFVRHVVEELTRDHADDPAYPFFDWIGFHNYNDFRNQWDAPDRPELVGKAAAFRAEQLHVAGVYDLRNMPLISTEVGLPSAPTDAYTERSEGYQAAYVGRVAARAAQADLEAAIWYTARDYTSDGNCDNPYSWLLWGLLRSPAVDVTSDACPTNPIPGYAVESPYERKPSFHAFSTASRLIGDAEHRGAVPMAVTGEEGVETHRLQRPDGSFVLVVFTDSGERLGSKSAAELAVSVEISDEWLAPGEPTARRIRMIDHLGDEQPVEDLPLVLELTHRPIYLVYEAPGLVR